MVMAVNASVPYVASTAASPTDILQRDNQMRVAVPPVPKSEAFAREEGVGRDAGTLAGMPSFAQQLAGARTEGELLRRRANTGESSKGEEKTAGSDLTEAEEKKVTELKQRDAEVRRHEQTHASIGGQFASSPQYEMEQGPDGRSYAVGGSVDIDVSPVSNDPEATISKMQVVQRAALAVDEPSAADRQIAANAAQQEQEARQELAKEKQQGDEDDTNEDSRAQFVAEAYLGASQPRQQGVIASA